MINPLYSASGFVVGALVGLTGVGGGSLMTPLLVLLFGIHPAVAVGTDLLYAAITKTGGTLAHAASRTVDWRITRRLAAGSVPAAAVTLFLMSRLGHSVDAGAQLITTVLGFALILTAITLVFRQKILDYFADRVGELDARRVAPLTVLLGAAVGALVTLSSVGAGAIGVTVLLMLYPRLPVARIVGSDIAHAVPLTLVAGLGYWFLGSTDWMLLGSLLVGSVPGVILGSFAAARAPDWVLRPILATTLALVGGKLAL
ncbi:MAG TPA: sulfite exporter TauE/SafE family protein [Xanthobacteraceae bacterium]|nr:sulfite exporter TauE/SafE family protein [Xanthobacteraceae bacterium]